MADQIKKLSAGHSIEVLDAIMTEVEEARGTYNTLDERLSDIDAETPTPSTAAPAMDGTAAAGTSTDYARADHIHPSDTSRANLENIAYKTAASSFSETNMQVVFDENMFSQSNIRGSVLMMFGTQKTSVSNTLLLVDFYDSGIKSIRYLTSGTGEVITAIGTIHNNKHGFNFTADANSYTYPCCLSLFANKDIKPNFTIVAQS